MTRYRSLWIITLFTISLWLTFPHSALTAPIDHAPAPTPTAILGNALMTDIPQARYPGIIFGALAIVIVIALGALVRARKR